MKIAVFSDSHGRSDKIREALRRRCDVDMAIFLGDGVGDFYSLKDEFPNVCFSAVRGNCDIGWYDVSVSDSITLEGYRIFWCHGHIYHVKGGVGNLISAAQSREADICLFGHTHVPLSRYISETDTTRPLYLVNPGSIGGRSSDGVCSFCVIELCGAGVSVSHIKL